MEVERLTALFEYETGSAEQNVEKLAAGVDRLEAKLKSTGKVLDETDGKTNKAAEGTKKLAANAEELGNAVSTRLNPKVADASTQTSRWDQTMDRAAKGGLQGLASGLNVVLRQIPLIGYPLAGITSQIARFATTSGETAAKVVKDAKTMEDAYRVFAAVLHNALVSKDAEKRGILGELLDDPLTKKYSFLSSGGTRIERERATPLARSPGQAFDKFTDSFNKIESSEERAAIAGKLFGKEAANLIPVLEGAAAGSTAAATGATSMGTSFLAVAAPIAIAVAVIAGLAIGLYATEKALFSLSKGAAEFSAKFDDVSKKTRLTTETISTLSAGAKLVDVDFGSVSKGLVEFVHNIDLANGGAKEQSAIVKQLSIDTSTQEKALASAFLALSKMPDGYKKNGLAAKLFGSDAESMLKIIERSGGSMSGFTAELEKFGVVVDRDGVLKAKEFNKQLGEFDLLWQGLKRQAGEAAIPAMTEQIKLLSKAFEGTGPGLAQTTSGIARLTTGVILATDHIFGLSRSLKWIGEEFGAPPPIQTMPDDWDKNASDARIKEIMERGDNERLAAEAIAEEKKKKVKTEADAFAGLKSQLASVREQARGYDAETIQQTESIKLLTNVTTLLTKEIRAKIEAQVKDMETGAAIATVISNLDASRRKEAQGFVNEINAQAALNQTRKDAKAVEDFLNKSLEESKLRLFELQNPLKENATETEKFDHELGKLEITNKSLHDQVIQSKEKLDELKASMKSEEPEKLAARITTLTKSLNQMYETSQLALRSVGTGDNKKFTGAIDQIADVLGKEFGLTRASFVGLDLLAEKLKLTGSLERLQAIKKELTEILDRAGADTSKLGGAISDSAGVIAGGLSADDTEKLTKNAALLERTIDSLNGKFRERGEITEEDRVRTETLTGALKDLTEAQKDLAISTAKEADARREAIDVKKEEEREAKKAAADRLRRAQEQASQLAGFIHDAITGAFADGWRGVLASFLRLLDTMLTRLLESQLLKIFSSMGSAGSSSSGGGGFWSGLFGAIFGGLTGSLGGGGGGSSGGGAVTPGAGGGWGGGAFRAATAGPAPTVSLAGLGSDSGRSTRGGGDTYVTQATINQTIHAPRGTVAPKSARQAAEQSVAAINRFQKR